MREDASGLVHLHGLATFGGHDTLGVPMKLSPEAIEEFREICREEYEKEISEGEATVTAQRLLLLYELIYRPLPSERAARQQRREHPASPSSPSPEAS